MGATIKVHSGFALDIRELDFSSLFNAYSYTRSSVLFRAEYGSGSADEFRGSGFRYNANGVATGGTIKSYAAISYGDKMFSIDGVSVAATKVVAAARTYSTGDDKKVVSAGLAGNDTFKGGAYGDWVSLYGGNDKLFGNGGRDYLKGGAGNDRIEGGAGGDHLYGESGKDTFIFKKLSDSTASGSGRDTIYDFSKKQGDKIDLSAIDANSIASGNQAFKFIGDGDFHGKAGELRFTKFKSDTYIQADVNGDKKADFGIHLDDSLSLSKGDFLL